jgi:hypothetical protein
MTRSVAIGFPSIFKATEVGSIRAGLTGRHELHWVMFRTIQDTITLIVRDNNNTTGII